MTANITGGFIIGKVTFFLGTIMILCILAMVVIDLFPDFISISILAGAICGLYLGWKWSKEGN